MRLSGPVAAAWTASLPWLLLKAASASSALLTAAAPGCVEAAAGPGPEAAAGVDWAGGLGCCASMRSDSLSSAAPAALRCARTRRGSSSSSLSFAMLHQVSCRCSSAHAALMVRWLLHQHRGLHTGCSSAGTACMPVMVGCCHAMLAAWPASNPAGLMQVATRRNDCAAHLQMLQHMRKVPERQLDLRTLQDYER